MYYQQVRHHRKQVHRRKVAHGVIRQLGKQRWPEAERADVAEDQRVTIGRGFRHVIQADIPAGARPVFHDHGLLPGFFKFLPDDARNQIGAAAGGEGHHQTYGFCGVVLRGVGLRVCRTRHLKHTGKHTRNK